MPEPKTRPPSAPNRLSVMVEPRFGGHTPAACGTPVHGCRSAACRRGAARRRTAGLIAGVVSGPLANPVLGAGVGVGGHAAW